MGTIDTHLRLLGRMAQQQGVDLTEARARDIVSDADFSDLLNRCRNCSDPEGCKAALDRDATPDTCANDSRWDALRTLSAY